MNQDAFGGAGDGEESAGTSPAPRGLRRRLLAQYPWLPFLLPFIVYMLLGSLEPSPPKAKLVGVAGAAESHDVAEPPVDGGAGWFGIRYTDYPVVYTVKIAATVAAMLLVLPGYRQFPCRVSLLAIVVGVVGVVLWIWLCSLQFEMRVLKPLGFGGILGLGERPAYNPLAQLAESPAWAYTFLGIRFLGLAVVVPIIEEFFLRGFLMRLVQDDPWWEVPFGTITPLAVAVGTGVPMLMHPAELLAAFVWFSLVTGLMVTTRNIWDCVAAHAVTNLLLGIYVVTQGQWQLW